MPENAIINHNLATTPNQISFSFEFIQNNIFPFKISYTYIEDLLTRLRSTKPSHIYFRTTPIDFLSVDLLIKMLEFVLTSLIKYHITLGYSNLQFLKLY